MKKLIPLIFILACAACLPPAAPPTPPKTAVPVRLTPEQAKKVEQLYYKAVGAYSRNDMTAANAHLKEILVINPAYKPALELREKIRLATKKN